MTSKKLIKQSLLPTIGNKTKSPLRATLDVAVWARNNVEFPYNVDLSTRSPWALWEGTDFAGLWLNSRLRIYADGSFLIDRRSDHLLAAEGYVFSQASAWPMNGSYRAEPNEQGHWIIT